MMTMICKGLPNDLTYIKSLAAKEFWQLGFVPHTTYEKVLGGLIKCQHIYIATDCGDLTGFMYAGLFRGRARIFQICIQSDARRWHRARLLVETFLTYARQQRATACSLRVAVDLEANLFWQGIGFIHTGTDMGKKGRKKGLNSRPILIYYQSLQRSLFPDAEMTLTTEVTVQDVQSVQEKK